MARRRAISIPTSPPVSSNVAEALRRIEECRREHPTWLHIGDLSLSEIPEEVFSLTQIEDLVVSFLPRDADKQIGIKDDEKRKSHRPNFTYLPKAINSLSYLRGITLYGVDVVDCDRLRECRALVCLILVDCGRVENLNALAHLPRLAILELGWCDVLFTLDALSHLTSLTSLKLGACNTLTNVDWLVHLTCLTSLSLVACPALMNVDGLAHLTSLTSLELSMCDALTNVDVLAQLTGLTSLTMNKLRALTNVDVLAHLTGLNSLDLRMCATLMNVDGLASLFGLTALNLSDCEALTNVDVLAQLTGLTSLFLNNCKALTNVNGLTHLTGLTRLSLHNCKALTNVNGLTRLTRLTSLNLSHCASLTNVDALTHLAALESLDLEWTGLRRLPAGIVSLPNLTQLSLYNTPLEDLPVELLGESGDDNCLEAVRAHLADLRQGGALDNHVKVLFLGDGRVGKTSVIRRLVHDLPPRRDEESTHSVQFSMRQLSGGPLRETANLQIWDFGGQDIYLGTHALFLKGNSVFVIVWDTETEVSEEHDDGCGHRFRNRHLRYWIEYARAQNPDAPVLIVQNKCVKQSDFRSRQAEFGGKGALWECAYCAETDRNRESLDDALRRALHHALRHRDARRIGRGRLAAREEIEKLRDSGQKVLALEDFDALCHAQGEGVTDSAQLLHYLHDTGVVFHDTQHFGRRLILDLRWACEAIYAALNRPTTYRYLLATDGQFTPEDLGLYAWDADGYAPEDQRLFLELMESCDVCFRLADDPATYMAPELLPPKAQIEDRLRDAWDDHAGPVDTLRVSYVCLHPGIMRSVTVRLGRHFRLGALYWRDGMFAADRKRGARALIEATYGNGSAVGWIDFQTKGDGRRAFLGALLNVTGIQWHGDKDGVSFALSVGGGPFAPFDTHQLIEEAHRGPETITPEVAQMTTIRTKHEVFISYCWADNESPAGESEGLVSRLDRVLTGHGYRVIRDTRDCPLRASIDEFMQRIGAGKCVITVLSDRYLRRLNCMDELTRIFEHRDMEQRIFPLVLPETRVFTMHDRGTYVQFWIKAQQIALSEAQPLLDHASPKGTTGDLDRHRRIRNNADEVLGRIATINCGAYKDLVADDFRQLRDVIDQRLLELEGELRSTPGDHHLTLKEKREAGEK